MIVAIDGPSGVGKSTVSQAVADRLGMTLLDTGALYRAAALLAVEDGISVEDGPSVAQRLARSRVEFRKVAGEQRLFVDGRDVSEAIRTPAISDGASRASAQPEVRAALLDLQRELGGRADCVVEGRDIGTVVFPDAPFKFFLEASVSERVRRRQRQYAERDREVDEEALRKEIVERDQRDRSRAHAPLKPADDAVIVDTTKMSFEEVVKAIVAKVGRG
jgi:cytidylate kinase